MSMCPRCKGTGQVFMPAQGSCCGYNTSCPTCGGLGMEPVASLQYVQIVPQLPEVRHCTKCDGDGIDPAVKDGTGQVARGEMAVTCPRCNGTGHVLKWPDPPTFTTTTASVPR